MKNSFVVFSNLLRAGLIQIATALILAMTMLSPAQAGSHMVEGQKVVIQAFTKSATRVCDKITYNFHVYILTDGKPVNVIISDVWPNGLLPASAVTMSGVTSSGPSIFVNSTSWSAQFETPVGVGPTVTSYTLNYTSTIDPVALNAGDFKMVNQAKIALGKSDPAYERSDDPAVSGQEDKTVLNIPVAEVKACMPPPPPPPAAKSCLEGNAEVTCGKVYGTYNITIKPNGVGGIIPTSVSITSLTPGVTLSPALSSYPVIGGQVTVTVAGATPGQVLDFNLDGTTAGGGSAYGTNLCCSGKISVTIPKDLDCPPPPSHVEIKKYCDPVVKGKDGVLAGLYSAICHIKVTTTGEINFPINISEALTAPGKVKYLSSNPATDPWACAPSPVTAPAPINCVLPANTMTSPSDVSIIDVLVTFPNTGAVKEAKNCAYGTYNGERLRKSCTDFHVDEKSNVEIKKVCDPLRPNQDGPVLGHGFTTRCKIIVTTTGPVTYPLNVAEALTGAGSVSFYSSSPALVWTCNPFVVSAPTPINCVANGGLNNTTSTSEFEFDVAFPNAAAANQSENCGVVNSPSQTAKKSCVKFPVDSTIKVEKTCGPVTYSKYAQGPAIDALGYHANCTITVTTTGPQSGPLTVSDAMTGGTASWMTSTSTPAWACSGTNCTINGAALNPSSSVSTFNVVVGFANAGDVQEAKNCAQVTGAEKKSCTGFPPVDGKIDIVKVCDAAKKTDAGAVIGLQAMCHITVTTTGPQSGTITIGDVLSGSGSLGNATAPAPWTCSASSCTVNGGSLNQTSSTTVIDVPVNFPLNNGQVQEAKNCAVLGVNGQSVKKSCTPIIITGGDKFGTLTVTKEASYNGNHILNVHFPIAVTCGGATTNVTVQDSVPYTQGNILLGTQCSVLETTIPPKGLCPEGQTEVWTTSYAPTGPVIVATATGTTIAVQNILNCKKEDIGTREISKVCDPVVEVVGAKNSFVSKCHITVTTTGPQSGTITATDAFTGIGTMSNATAPAPWTCAGSGCSVNGAALNQTSSTSVIDVTISFANTGNAFEARNCANLNEKGKESCTGFVVDPPKNPDFEIAKTGLDKCQPGAPCPFTISITSIGQPYNGNVLLYDVLTPNLAWPVTSIVPNVCGGSITTMPFGCVANLNLAANTPFTFTVTLNPVTGNALDRNENCISAAFVNSSVPTGPKTPAEIQAMKASGQLGTPVESCWKFGVEPPIDVKSKQAIEKTCEPAFPKKGAEGLLEAKCKITVTTTGPQAGTVSFVDSPTGVIGIVSMNSTSTPAWTCTLIECSIPGAQLNQTSSVSTFEVVANFYNANQVNSAQNCAQMQDGTTPYGEKSCSKFVMGDVVDSQLYVKKVVVNHAPGSVEGLQFWIEDNCNSNQNHGQAYLKDGDVVHYKLYEAGVSCQIYENNYPPTTACGDLKPVWSTTYSPSQTVALSPNGETVTVTNTLDCEPVNPPNDGNPIKVKKVVINNAPLPIDSSLQFPITVTCVKGNNGEALDTDATHTVADGQTVTYLPYAAGFSCSAHEGTIPQTNACGKGATPVWNTSYSAQPVPMTPAGETITVTNTLNCKKIIIDTPVCPPRTHYDAKSGKCVDDRKVCVAPFVLNSKTNSCYLPLPDCRPGTHLEGKVCVENAVRCKSPTVRNPDTNTCYTPRPVCKAPKVYNAATNSCIIPRPNCGPSEVYNPKRNTCQPKKIECQPGTHLEGKRCVVNEQRCQPGTMKVGKRCLVIPRCRLPEIPVPGTGLCVNPFGGGGGGRDHPKGDGGNGDATGGIRLPGL